MADHTPTRTRRSFNNPPQARVSSFGIRPTNFPQVNRLILRLVSKLLTWLGPSHHWLTASQDESSLWMLPPLGCVMILTALAATGNLLWTPVLLGATAIPHAFISVWSFTYWSVFFGFAAYLSIFGALTASVLVPGYGGRFSGGITVHLYVILCSVWIVFIPLVVAVSTIMYLCGKELEERYRTQRIWPQQPGTFEFELGMMPPPESEGGNIRSTSSERYVPPTYNRDRSTNRTAPSDREEIVTDGTFL